MPCFYARDAWQIREGEKLVFTKPNAPATHYKVPCNYCLGCVIQQSIHWQVRIMHELSMHESALFVTLTYEPRKEPPNGDLNFEHHRLWIKRLRRAYPEVNLRYFTAGEYGGTNAHPHYHAIIFGLELPDLVVHDQNRFGQKRYTSEKMTALWGKGHVIIGEVSHQSARYVASHMEKALKDLGGMWTQDDNGIYVRTSYRTRDPETGRVIELTNPQTRQSRRPGIGASWLDKYYDSCKHGHIMFRENRKNLLDKKASIKMRKYQIPPYYLARLKETHPELAAKIKEAARKFVNDEYNRWNSSPERMAIREKCLQAKLNNQGRASMPEIAPTIKNKLTDAELERLEKEREYREKLIEKVYSFHDLAPLP